MKHTVEELLGPDPEPGELEALADPYGYEPLSASEIELLSNLLSPEQARELLGISRQGLDQIMRAGRLPTIRIGRVRLVLRRDLARFAEVEGRGHLERARRWKRVALRTKD